MRGLLITDSANDALKMLSSLLCTEPEDCLYAILAGLMEAHAEDGLPMLPRYDDDGRDTRVLAQILYNRIVARV